ncbi:MAG: 3-deoxy-7-phosphoheptulonate synthase [Planctomycetota bacterium]|nr:3-deoxy-7-phosphoheptulonate synthase [Planctomycetota bacterium]
MTNNLRVVNFEKLDSPDSLKALFPLTDIAEQTVARGRDEIMEAMSGRDQRLVVIAGPCSIHDTKSALEYAERLAELRREVQDKILLVMRVYFEKPRTSVGWKGLINDPHLDQSFDVQTGLSRAREILLSITSLGLPCATEFLDPIVPQYTSDLVSWAAIGARTTESQTHREMASGLSMPVGFKNATDGSLEIAINAMLSAQSSHSFLGIDDHGYTSVVRAMGNPNVHLVLRGGRKPNWSKAHIAYANVLLEQFENKRLLMVDCSHGNSNKDYRKQPNVFEGILQQYKAGENTILGVMLESHLNSGKQSLGGSLKYGQSITDGCIDWDTTKSLLLKAREAL